MMEGVDNELTTSAPSSFRDDKYSISSLTTSHFQSRRPSGAGHLLMRGQLRPSCSIPWVITFPSTLLHHLFICFSPFKPDSRFRLLLSLLRILKFGSLFDGEPDECTIPLTSSKFTGALHLAVQSMGAIQSTARHLPGLQGGLRFSKTLVNYPDENPEPTRFGVEVV